MKASFKAWLTLNRVTADIYKPAPENLRPAESLLFIASQINNQAEYLL